MRYLRVEDREQQNMKHNFSTIQIHSHKELITNKKNKSYTVLRPYFLIKYKLNIFLKHK